MDVASTTAASGGSGKKNPLFLAADTFGIRMKKDMDQCCCADVPCVSIVKEYCESRYTSS